MIKIYSIDQTFVWDEIVKSFPKWDVYYLNGYVKAFMIHGDGIPQLLYYESDGMRAIYVYMLRETSIADYHDSITPYGYGGVLFDRNATTYEVEIFWKEYLEKMKQLGIVDNFVRYHPVLDNAKSMKTISTVIDLGHTIAFDLASPEVIWDNITSKNRNMIRKAEKNGIVIKHCKNLDMFDCFMRIYNGTMDKDHAEEYYYFKEKFYESIHNDLHDHYEMFYADLDGKIIAMSIILYGNGQMHYHLSGSLSEYRHLAPTNLLLYKAALWGSEQGFNTFHLGGGVGSGEDNLYKFKAAFNRNSNYQFSIGKMIFDEKKYRELVELRAANDTSFDSQSHFFPLYRS